MSGDRALSLLFGASDTQLNIDKTEEFNDAKLRYFVTSRLAPDTEAFYKLPLTENEIQDYINKLPSHRATGYDGMSVKILKIIVLALIPRLKRMMNFNNCFDSSPDTFRVSFSVN